MTDTGMKLIAGLLGTYWLGHVADVLATSRAVAAYGVGYEMNPVARWLMSTFSLDFAFLAKVGIGLFVTAFILYEYREGRTRTALALAGAAFVIQGATGAVMAWWWLV